jgi:hypothetical protein
MILFMLFTNDVTICMELDPSIHIDSTWFVLETGCDISYVRFFLVPFGLRGSLERGGDPLGASLE